MFLESNDCSQRQYLQPINLNSKGVGFIDSNYVLIWKNSLDKSTQWNFLWNVGERKLMPSKKAGRSVNNCYTFMIKGMYKQTQKARLSIKKYVGFPD